MVQKLCKRSKIDAVSPAIAGSSAAEGFTLGSVSPPPQFKAHMSLSSRPPHPKLFAVGAFLGPKYDRLDCDAAY